MSITGYIVKGANVKNLFTWQPKTGGSFEKLIQERSINILRKPPEGWEDKYKKITIEIEEIK